MCGRYAASRSPDDLAIEFEAVRAEGQPPLPADYNVAPTKDVLRRPAQEGARRRGRAHRGRAPRAARRPLGAGAVVGQGRVGRQPDAQRPGRVADRQAGVPHRGPHRRCLVPADGWYEWAKRLDAPTKQPYFVTPQDGSEMAFAGLWEVWGRGEDRLYTCTVVTAPAVGALTEIHERMPLVLPPDRWAAWLDPSREDVEALVEPTPPELVETLRDPPGEHRGEQRRQQRPELTARAESVSEPADQPALF